MVTDAEVYQYAVRKDVDVVDMNKTMAYTVRLGGNVSSADDTFPLLKELYEV